MTRMFSRSRLVLSAALAILVISATLVPGRAVASGVQPQALTAGPPAASGKLVIAFDKKGATAAEVAASLTQRGLRLEQWLPGLGLARAAVQPTAELAAAVTALSQDPAVVYVTQERMSVEVADTPQDEYWSGQWGPDKVGLAAARDIAWGDPSVVIAVVDTGVRYTHWDLRDQMWINPGESEIDPLTGQRTCNTGNAINGQDDDQNGYADDCRGYNFDADNNDPDDAYGHGTAVAGIAGAATNNPGHYTSGGFEGIAGMGGAARIMAVRAMNAKGAGYPFNIAEAVRYAADNGAQVINLSLTLPVNYNPDDADMLCRATDYAQSKGALVVAASGNHSTYALQPVSYPAACPGVIAVGASTASDTRAIFSDGGSRLDLVAPGENITSTLRTTNTSYGIREPAGGFSISGTSFAAPHVAGAAALVRGLRPDLGPAAVGDLLRGTAKDVGAPGFDAETGWGRLDAARALAQGLDGLSLQVTFDPPTAAAGNSARLRVQMTGPGGEPAGFGARITLTGVLGVVSPATVTADAGGIATATFTPGSAAGAGRVTATIGGLRASIPIMIGRPVFLPFVAR